MQINLNFEDCASDPVRRCLAHDHFVDANEMVI